MEQTSTLELPLLLTTERNIPQPKTRPHSICVFLRRNQLRTWLKYRNQSGNRRHNTQQTNCPRRQLRIAQSGERNEKVASVLQCVQHDGLMCVYGVVRLQCHLHQILCGPNGAGIHHRSIEIIHTGLRSIEDFAPFVNVATQIHDDRQQPVFVWHLRPFGQFDVLAKDTGASHPDDVIGIEEQSLGEFAERQSESERQVWVMDAFQWAVDQV